MIFMCHINGISQDVYLILTSQTTLKGVNLQEGIKRSYTGAGEALYKYPSIHFNLISKSKIIRETYLHSNYNPVELIKIRPVTPNDQMEILIKPLSFLQTITPIDLDVLFHTWTKAQAEAFGLSMRGKKIYIIDRTDIKNGTVKLIQVEYFKPLSF